MENKHAGRVKTVGNLDAGERNFNKIGNYNQPTNLQQLYYPRTASTPQPTDRPRHFNLSLTLFLTHTGRADVSGIKQVVVVR